MSLQPLFCLVLLLVALVAAVEAGLSKSEKKELLSAHNRFRRSVDPPATNMIKLQWDDELALLGQFWSARCEMMTNEERHDQSTDYDYVGENFVATANYSYSLTTMVESWFLQKENYDYYSAYCSDGDDYDYDDKRNVENSNQDEDPCGGYTQLVWAYSQKIGCGVYRCSELRGWEDANGDNENALLLVCYYGPGGNYYGEQPYKSGRRACSQCPSGFSKCHNGLCTSNSALFTHGSAMSVPLLLILGAISLVM